MRPEPIATLPAAWIEALSSLRYGLYFLSTGSPAQPQGLLVSWVSQVSGQPPMVMTALRHNRACLPALRECGRYALNLLPAGTDELRGQLARPAAQRWQGLAVREGPLGLPVLEAAAGAICCRVKEAWRPGDHDLLLGHIEDVVWRAGAQALPGWTGAHAYLGLA